jgi:hypothetical protein
MLDMDWMDDTVIENEVADTAVWRGMGGNIDLVCECIIFGGGGCCSCWCTNMYVSGIVVCVYVDGFCVGDVVEVDVDVDDVNGGSLLFWGCIMCL